MSWDAKTNKTQMNGGDCVSFCVQTNPLCKLYMKPYGKNYKADTDALNKNVVQYRGECE